jgi:hypothetical protein
MLNVLASLSGTWLHHDANHLGLGDLERPGRSADSNRALEGSLLDDELLSTDELVESR